MKHRYLLISIGALVLIPVIVLLYLKYNFLNLEYSSERRLFESHIESVEPLLNYEQLQIKAEDGNSENSYPWLWFKLFENNKFELDTGSNTSVEIVPANGVITYQRDDQNYVFKEINSDQDLMHPSKDPYSPSATYGTELVDFPNMTINFKENAQTTLSFPADFETLHKYVGFNGEHWQFITGGINEIENVGLDSKYGIVIRLNEGVPGIGYLNFNQKKRMFMWGQNYQQLKTTFVYGETTYNLSMGIFRKPNRWMIYPKGYVYEPCYFETVPLHMVGEIFEKIPCN